MEERLRCKGSELDAAKYVAEAAQEALHEAEARGRDLYDENKRLSEHISVGGWVGVWLWAGWWVTVCLGPCHAVRGCGYSCLV